MTWADRERQSIHADDCRIGTSNSDCDHEDCGHPIVRQAIGSRFHDLPRRRTGTCDVLARARRARPGRGKRGRQNPIQLVNRSGVGAADQRVAMGCCRFSTCAGCRPALSGSACRSPRQGRVQLVARGFPAPETTFRHAVLTFFCTLRF